MLAAMVKFAKTLKLAPAQNPMQYEIVKKFYADTKANGFKFAVGSGEIPEGNGLYTTPAIIDNPPSDSMIITEEPFVCCLESFQLELVELTTCQGPIVPTQPWTDEDEVIARANNTDTCLGACVWSADLQRAERTAYRLDAGSVWVNSFEKPGPLAPFGGLKLSGMGTEWGQGSLTNYCNQRAIHVYKVQGGGRRVYS